MKVPFSSRERRYAPEEEQEVDHREPKRTSAQKKRDSIIRTYEEPVLPKLAKILFISMFVITAVLLLVEINAFLRYSPALGVRQFLINLTTTGLAAWGIYSVLLAITCAVGIRLNTAAFRKKQLESGVADQTEADRQRSAKAIRRLNATYRLYLKFCFVGLVLWLAFYLVVQLVS